MKPSYYNFIYHTESSSYWMNGITHACLKFSKILGEKVEGLLENIPLLLNNSKELYDILVNGGFIIPKQTDEYKFIYDRYMESVQSKHYFLILLPTLNCNFTCPYCVQTHIPSKMSEETINKVKKHLKHMVEIEHIQSLTLEWFGGEPFLYFNEVIKPITLYAKEICENAHIPFISGATTNGSLINSSIAAQLPALEFLRFQITLDGDEKLHNTVKFNPAINSAFKETLNNITSILNHNPHAFITLRINYTDETLKSNLVNEICSQIPHKLRSKVTVTLKKVWQHSADKNRFSSYIEILDNFKAEGFNVTKLDISSSFIPCYVNKKYYACINYDGGAIKCTNCDDLYASNLRGELNDNGRIIWNDKFDIQTQNPSFTNEPCRTCKRLPLCMGHCPKNHLMMSDWKCKWPAFDIDLKQAVISYIDDLY